MVAEARKEFNEAVISSDMLKVLPDIAAEVASPLSNFEEIVLIRNSNNNESKRGDSDKKMTGKSTSVFVAEAAMPSNSVPQAINDVDGSEQSYFRSSWFDIAIAKIRKLAEKNELNVRSNFVYNIVD